MRRVEVKSLFLRLGSALLAGLSAVMLLPSHVSAGTVYVNSPSAIVTGESSPTVFGAKFRMSNTNFDMSLDNGLGTQSFGPGFNSFVSAGLGNNTQLSNRTLDFVLEHFVGLGYRFTMTDPSNTPLFSARVLSWGNASLGGTNASTLATNNSGGTRAPDFADHNAIVIEARGERTGSSMAFSDLAFSSSLAQIGSFQSGSVTPGGQGPNNNNTYNPLPNVFSPKPSFYYQFALIQPGLSFTDFNWSLTGKVTGARDNSAGGDETVRFQIMGKNLEYTVTQSVPEPSSLLIFAGLGMALVAGRRHRRLD